VLKDQTRINPFDDYCYDLLGRTLWRQQKYDEAVAAFRKQIEVTPLHREAHGNLGQMLVEWRKYKEALPELEQGIALNPEGESLYVNLVARISKLARPQKQLTISTKPSSLPLNHLSGTTLLMTLR